MLREETQEVGARNFALSRNGPHNTAESNETQSPVFGNALYPNPCSNSTSSSSLFPCPKDPKRKTFQPTRPICHSTSSVLKDKSLLSSIISLMTPFWLDPLDTIKSQLDTCDRVYLTFADEEKDNGEEDTPATKRRIVTSFLFCSSPLPITLCDNEPIHGIHFGLGPRHQDYLGN